MTILVTGGAGFVGINLVHHLRRARPDEAVVVLDKLTYAAQPEAIEGVDGVELVVGDIGDTALVRELLVGRGIDRLIHCAAESHVDNSIAAPAVFVQTNVNGTQSMLDAAKAAWLDTGSGRPHRFLHVSTDEVYGALGPDDAPFTEAHAAAPNSPYAASKAASDHLVRAWHKTYGLDAVVTRCSNNYGPWQFAEKLVPLCITRALSGGELPIYGDGQQVRDWIHVGDHCAGIAAALDRGESGRTYNLGGEAEWANIDLVERLCAAIDRAFARNASLSERFPDCPAAGGDACASLIRHVADRPGHDRRYAIDAKRARTEIGFRPATEFETGLEATVAHYLARAESRSI